MKQVIFLALALVLTASPAAAELDGPVAVVDRAHPSTVTTSDGYRVATYPAVPGVHLICTPAFLAAHADVLSPYVDADQSNLEAVYAGDDPAHPSSTVALTFPDQATADAVRAQLLPTS